MIRGIDHIVHAVRDLDAAAALYRSLGFTVGGRNVHPHDWGTQNRIVQLPGTFVELLSMVDESGTAAHAPRRFSFGAFNRDFLAEGEGLSMLALKGGGQPDAEKFRANGIGDFEIYEFEREGKRPDGRPLAFSFALAFARDLGAPDIGFFTCQHRHPPENFWNREFQKHANGASSVAGVVLVASEPLHHREFLERFSGGTAATHADGFIIETPRGHLDMLTPAAFTGRYGVKAPGTLHGGRLAAIRFTIADRTALRSLSDRAADSGRYDENTAVIGAGNAMGAVLVFEPSR